MEGLIDWQEWGRAAFVKARKEKKPLLLNISAVWCHWCHTMDRLTYSNEEVARFINSRFVPVKVDTDLRPDINERYNVGGWPSTLVLAHDGEPVSGATYVPPEHMARFLEDALVRFKKYEPKKRRPETVRRVKVDPGEFYGVITSFYDPVNGGFGLEPKFPQHDILEYLFWRVDSFKDADAKKMLDHSLSAMLNGEFFDHVGGGFFRYATLQNWTIPHFEKMLDDNARLLFAYVRAYKLFRKREYLSAANKTLFFLFTMLYDAENGVFYGSQDADEEYCKLELEKRLKARQPFVDRHIYTDSNALAAIALLEASTLDKSYERFALQLLDAIYRKNVRSGVVHYSDEKQVCLLRDAVYLLSALLHGFLLTRRLECKSRALTVAKHLEKFYDRKNGGFFDVLKTKDSVGRLKDRKKPVVENAVAALALNTLADITKIEKYRVMARKSLEAVSASALGMGAYAALWALASTELKS